ncbi:hypothetical protein [Actinomyces faecalis]|uniref:hypothetical protein n=1 Tax=Actinomyces faecalis TaxID=2722820 RepID=UPI001552F8D3|nr:hypothetical protein [Actinomyces faecalis]
MRHWSFVAVLFGAASVVSFAKIWGIGSWFGFLWGGLCLFVTFHAYRSWKQHEELKGREEHGEWDEWG